MHVTSVLRRLRKKILSSKASLGYKEKQELLSQKKKKNKDNITISYIPKEQHVNNKVKYAYA